MLDKNSGLKQTHILLEKPFINISCPDQIESIKRNRINTDTSSSSKKKKEKYERNFTIRTKTGKKIIYNRFNNHLFFIKVIKLKQVQQLLFIFNYLMIKNKVQKIFV